jgi:hypothetical protein
LSPFDSYVQDHMIKWWKSEECVRKWRNLSRKGHNLSCAINLQFVYGRSCSSPLCQHNFYRRATVLQLTELLKFTEISE